MTKSRRTNESNP